MQEESNLKVLSTLKEVSKFTGSNYSYESIHNSLEATTAPNNPHTDLNIVGFCRRTSSIAKVRMPDSSITSKQQVCGGCFANGMTSDDTKGIIIAKLLPLLLQTTLDPKCKGLRGSSHDTTAFETGVRFPVPFHLTNHSSLRNPSSVRATRVTVS